jgi:hypothetical protein
MVNNKFKRLAKKTAFGRHFLTTNHVSSSRRAISRAFDGFGVATTQTCNKRGG